MGRPSWTQRLTIEECISLSAREFVRFRRYAYLGLISTVLNWAEGDNKQEIQCMLKWSQGQIVLHMSVGYLTQVVSTTTTACRFGGTRLWFLCPGIHNPCGRRCVSLFLPPRGNAFACRLCHNLTYRSSQEHDKRIDRLMRNPELLSVMLGSRNRREAMLGLSAYAKLARKLMMSHRSSARRHRKSVPNLFL
jgi:hypothetical protein